MVFCVEIGNDNVPFVQLGDNQLRLELEDLDDDYKERSKEELRETPQVVEEALRQFRDLIIDEPALHVALDDDKYLMKFLRPFRFYPEDAFKALKKFYKFKVKNPKFCMDVAPGSVRNVFDNEIFVFLPTRTPSGSRIMLINAGTKWNPKVVTIQDIFKSIMVATEIAMLEPKTQVGGVHIIINMEGFSLTHVYQLSPFVAKLIVDWVQEYAPIRLHGIHIINQSIFFNMAYTIFKPFLGEKLTKRLYFHGNNRNILCNKIAPHCLPESLGGTGTDLEYPGTLLSEMFFYYEETFKRLNNCYYSKEKILIEDEF